MTEGRTPESKERSPECIPDSFNELKLFFLGAPRLELEGQSVKVDTRKAIALLAYLALTGQSHTRDALAAFLWPEAGQKRARAALRRTISALNKGLAGQWLEVDRESVALVEGYWLDVEQFQQQAKGCGIEHQESEAGCVACLSAWSKAISLYRDDFLAGFTLRDSAAFDDWQFFQAESMRQELSETLERLVNGYRQRGDWERAISYARRWLNLDPLHEPAHRHLMELFARSDQRAVALRQYRTCVRILDQELGVPPLAETTQLYEAIRENTLPALLDNAETNNAPLVGGQEVFPDETLPISALPLMGRASELATLHNAFKAIQTDGRLMVIQGEVGVGKTRLAEEFLAQVREVGGVTISTRCFQGEANLAYDPFLAGLRMAFNQPRAAENLQSVAPVWLSETARLLPELLAIFPDLPPVSPVDDPGTQGRFFEGMGQVLQALCRGSAPGLFFIDDLQWADKSSLDLLTYLVRRLQGRPLCFLVTWRSEPVPISHRLHQLLMEGIRNNVATSLDLSPLDTATVLQLVQAVHPTQAEERLAQRLYQETKGIPYFLAEYLTMLEGQAIDTTTDNPDTWQIPSGVRNLLQSRLAVVSETGAQLLSTAAVIGRSFDFDTLRSASGRSEEETVTALEALISQRFVTETSGGNQGLVYDFSHEKLRDLVYEQTSLARRRLLHRRVAETLERFNPTGQAALAGQIAYHYQFAGQETKAAEFFWLAGTYARQLFANGEALLHFQSALALNHPETTALHMAIGDLYTLAGDYNLAITAYETAAALGELSLIAKIEHKLGEVHHRLGAYELAEMHFQAALAELASDSSAQIGLQARIYADHSRTAYQRGSLERATALAEQALTLAEQAEDTTALAQTHNILGILANERGNAAQAHHHLKQSLILAKQMANPTAQVAALNNLALAHQANDALEPALELTRQALRLCQVQGDRHREAALHNNVADVLHQLGRSEEAMTHLKQAVQIFAEIGAEAGETQPEIWKLVSW